MQQSQHTTQPPRSTSRQSVRQEQLPGTLFSALSIGVVLLLLASTFLADWLRAPEVTLAAASSTLLSPNNDLDHDTATVSYTLTEEADVKVDILSEGGGIVRNLYEQASQPAGQYFATWDGQNNLGQIAADGFYRLQVTAGGSVRSAVRSVVLQVDTRPPALQLANLADGARVGEPNLTLQGLTDPDAVVWINNDAQPIRVDGMGRFNIQRRLNEGTNLIEIKAVDQAGNATRVQRQVFLVTAPPEIAIQSPLENEWIKSPLVTVSGTAPAGANLTINDRPVVVNNGAFRYEILLDEGDNLLRLVATDDVGNATTVERLIHIKTTPPTLLLSLTEGVTLASPQVQLVGRTDPGAVVLMNQRLLVVGSSGEFQVGVDLQQGENFFVFEARDQAGNSTSITRRVIYNPSAPSSNLDRLARNLTTLPPLTIPLLIIVPLVIFWIFQQRQRQLTMSLMLDQSAFTPGLPGEDKVLLITLELNSSAQVTIEVLDSLGRTRATILRNRRREARQHVLYWDGYDDYDRPIAGGEYIIQASAGSAPAKVTSAVRLTIHEDRLVQQTYTRQSVEAQTPAAPSPRQTERRRRR